MAVSVSPSPGPEVGESLFVSAMRDWVRRPDCPAVVRVLSAMTRAGKFGSGGADGETEENLCAAQKDLCGLERGCAGTARPGFICGRTRMYQAQNKCEDGLPNGPSRRRRIGEKPILRLWRALVCSASMLRRVGLAQFGRMFSFLLSFFPVFILLRI
jgi:hypothetical protein